MILDQVLILPGLGNSGEEHWQTRWQQQFPTWVRVQQASWEAPQCNDWVTTLEKAVLTSGPGTVLVAHSLACLLVAHWVAGGGSHARVAGAFLVAPPDPAGPLFPATAHGFAPVPGVPFPFPSLVVSSTNDPYAHAAFALDLAQAWGSRHVSVGDAGHINAKSGLGAWAEGLALLSSLFSSKPVRRP